MIFLKTGLKRTCLAAAAVVAGVLALSAAPALAHGAGGAGGGMGAGGMGAGVHAGGTVDGSGTPAGGLSRGHMSPQGSTNTNGPNSTDRDFGRDRASDRTDADGTGHAHNASFGAGPRFNNRRWHQGRHHHYGWHG